MNMFAKFDEILAMTFQDNEETNVTDRRIDGQTDNVKTVYPPQTKFVGGIMILKLAIWNTQNYSHLKVLYSKVYTGQNSLKFS